mmetsp:Transcript_870/g.1758  ORF Transcript_870/g.1758 Transcript_870/m.1758 type:complete len:815 (-) Transcript_870:632-3076(-)
MEVEAYNLRATLSGHEQDIRSISALSDGTLITGSRDATLRLWKPSPDEELEPYTCSCTLTGHTHYVGSVASTPSGGVLSGSNDKHVIEWDITSGIPARILEGHENAVSCVAPCAASGQLLSASWDKTARVWDKGVCIHTLIGHEAAVWSVLPLEDGTGRVLTASADRTIKLWEQDRCVKTFIGHSDVVRTLALVPGVGFLSGSNDGTIRLWDLAGECLRVVQASDSFVYNVNVLASGEWMTCSEDRTVRLWDCSSGECIQSITHPSTVWACTPLPNGDLASGCADGNAYVWTRSPSRVAAPDALAAFKENVASVALPAQAMAGDQALDTANLPSEEALIEPGTKEGQLKVVKDSTTGTPMAYQWSNGSRSWEKVGEVVGSKDDGGGGATMGKRLFDGKEWDYLFDIDINGAMLKLPFNRGDDPYMAAQQWLWKNDVDQGFLDQVANFIITNTPGNVPVAAGNADPFTSGGAYRPAPSSASGTSVGNVDPFTSSGAYRPSYAQPPAAAGTDDSVKRQRPAQQVPFIAFDQCKHDTVLAKLEEFNAALAADGVTRPLALNAADMALLGSLVRVLKVGGAVSAAQVTLLLGGGKGPCPLAWPAAQLFPVLDVLRLLVLAPTAAPFLAALEPPLISQLARLMPTSDLQNKTHLAVALMVQRCFANLAYNSATRKLVVSSAGEVLDTLASPIEEGSSGLRLAASTVLLNACLMLKENNTLSGETALRADALQLQTLSLCAHALSSVPAMTLLSEEEALYRLLVAVGTLIGLGATTHSLALDLDIPAALQSLTLPEGASPKIKETLERVLATLASASSKQ